MRQIPDDYGDLAPTPRPRTAMDAAGFYRKKPCTVEARPWRPANIARVGEVIGWLLAYGADFHCPGPATGAQSRLAVRTSKGEVATAEPGDWVTRTADDEFDCVPDAEFRETYELADGTP